MVRIIGGTNSKWYEKSSNRRQHCRALTNFWGQTW